MNDIHEGLSIMEAQLFHRLNYLMKRAIVKYIDWMIRRLNVLYSQIKRRFSLHCFSLYPIWDLEELRHGVRTGKHLIELLFSFHKVEDWLSFQPVLLTIVHALLSAFDHAS